jgi:predicted DNA-binding protein
MHTTTVRFSTETWAQLKAHCLSQGVPAAQYIREATTARLLHSAPADHAIARELRELTTRVAEIERELRRHAPRGHR